MGDTPTAAYGDLEVAMPEGFGKVVKKTAMSGLIPEDQFREVVSRLASADVADRRNALGTMYGWSQNNSILSDMLTFEDGVAYKELEKSRDMMLPLMEAEMEANSNGKEHVTAGGETYCSAESDYHFAVGLLRMLDNQRGYYLNHLDEYAAAQKAALK